MKHIIEVFTYQAILYIFDEASFPSDFDRTQLGAPQVLLHQLAAESKLWMKETEDQDNYYFHVYVNEAIPPPPDKVIYTLDQQYDHFVCTSGKLWISGDSIHQKKDEGKNPANIARGILDSYINGGSVDLPAGDCSMSISTVNYDDSKELWKIRRGPLIEKLVDLFTGLPAAIGLIIAFISIFVGLYGLVFNYSVFLSALEAFGKGVLFFLTGLAVSSLYGNSSFGKKIAAEAEAKRRELPDFIVEIRTI